MRYKESEYKGRNWYGQTKQQNRSPSKRPKQSMFYAVIHWFETWVLIFLIAMVSLFVYLSQ
jgi:hypothetical protein